MLLGKRPRPPMRRTTSSAEFAVVLFDVEAPQPLDQDAIAEHLQAEDTQSKASGGEDWRATRFAGSMLSSGGGLRVWNSGDFAAGTTPFLRACGLCNRRLGPGQDAFMYRGDIAFCSLECRQQKMNQDEQRDKYSLISPMKDAPLATSTCSNQSDSGGTMATTYS